MRQTASGSFHLPIPASRAIGFFTPEGERAWVPGWNPTYAEGEPSEAPGTVFVTSHGDTENIWIIQDIDRRTQTSAYSRVTLGHHAGTVHVGCFDTTDGGCEVHVTYDMSLLPGADPAALYAYDDLSFQDMMKDWADGVSQHL